MSTFVASPVVQALSANQIAQQRESTTLRDAAYMIGIGRVAEASRLRGCV